MNTSTQTLESFFRSVQVEIEPPATGITGQAVRGSGSAKVARVLYVIDELCQVGGAERMLLELAKRLSPERFRSSILTFRINRELEALKSLPCPLHVLPLRRTYDLHGARMALRLLRFLRAEKFSIVHTFFETSDLWAAPLSKLSGRPVLISSRRDMGILRKQKHELAYRLVNPIFDRVLAVSEGVRSYCISHDRLPGERVQTLHNGIDLLELDSKALEGDVRRDFGISDRAPLVSTVANIRFVKGIDILVKAAAHVRELFPDAIFFVAGAAVEPATFATLQASVESLGLGKNFHFLGQLSNPYPVLRASNVFCLPSRNEGFSNALIEAMSCRLPCVATRVGGNAEALEEGKSGFLVHPEDDKEMARRIITLLGNAGMARAMGQNGRATVEARFTMQAMTARLMQIYDELLVANNA